ncbi:MAG TPA: 23S rRNA (uracil(1939)-C(5))-methyltransferase RlmD [Desulfobulbaceae bacterium]|nr:23S rRNA (uracil(1939)-C(5))-methyltransferase RlmD [Desulfobulbaceae bacterium]
MKLERIEITKIINGGYGLGQLPSGQIVLVRHVLPGEIVTVTTEKTKKNYISGEARQIIAAHPARRLPPCPYVGECGGCDLQHCGYETQPAIKKTIVADLLGRSPHREVKEAVQLGAEPIAAPAEFGYRQRIRLQVDSRGGLGFHRFQSHTVVPIEACLLARTEENEVLAAIKAHADGRKLTGIAIEVELQENPISSNTVVIFHLPRQPRPAEIAAAERFARDAGNVERIFFAGDSFSLMGPYGSKTEGADNSLAVHYPADSADKTMAVLPGDFTLTWEAGGFCQVNLAQNRNLIATVLCFCEAGKSDRVLDLFCGMGNFAIPLAMQAGEVLGIEGQGSAIRSAVRNAAAAGLTNALFRKSPIHAACAELVAAGERFDCVVIDPPRQGAPDLAAALATLARRRLVYISCDPATLCRDLAALCDKGFAIRKIQPIDMFPQTHHIETVVLLELKSAS